MLFLCGEYVSESKLQNGATNEDSPNTAIVVNCGEETNSAEEHGLTVPVDTLITDEQCMEPPLLAATPITNEVNIAINSIGYDYTS
uniref:Uncharacterized protein n=1 Tax=Timema shepardi TaxID=629360 RepID=A0A7R9AWW4_TIMSH|nr:unnamed protein product [Timema shepardi]